MDLITSQNNKVVQEWLLHVFRSKLVCGKSARSSGYLFDKAVLLVSVAWGRCTRSVSDDDEANCAEPRDIEVLTADNYANIIEAQTNSLYPGWNDDNSFDRIPAQYKNITYIHFQGDNVDCNAAPTVASQQTHHRHRHHHHHRNHRLNHIASCAFKYVKNWDENRIPAILLETKCSCPNPVDRQGICEEVHMYVSVYRRSGCYLGQWQYERVWEKISVSCITVRIPDPTQLTQESPVMGSR